MDEFPPWLNVAHEPEWRDYLTARTNAVLRLHDHPISTDTNKAAGTWLRLP
jgi:hypothetical protein